ncbi:MAG: VPLPA-CTERM-specific exosortase XrtD [Burkholderiales bacterium]|nr:VPLPA-CTERM-specific exosortase XrtD [Burkholderiales bacterium]
MPEAAAGAGDAAPGAIVVWRQSLQVWLALAVGAVLLYAAFHTGLDAMVRIWRDLEEYSFGYMVPAITAFLIWQRKDKLERLAFDGHWMGPAAVVAGAFLLMLANLSTITVVEQYAFLLTLFGVVLSLTGWQAFRIILVPLLILLFMIPLPLFMINQLSEVLQLISSELGVMVIRACDISVFLDGNVIDLGVYKLQVADACSGLRYLFPLMTLGFIAAYLFNAPLWQRAIIFLSTIPVTVGMNSLRIGIIGVTVNIWGIQMAEGFLHFFEGWIIFMACMTVLLAEMWLLLRFTRPRRTLRDSFVLEPPAPMPPGAVVRHRAIPRTLWVALVLVALAALANNFTPERQLIKPERKEFLDFPLSVEGYRGQRERLSSVELDVLKLDDYIYANFRDQANRSINFYVAWHDIQGRGTVSTHSPRSCMPGGGWNITEFDEKILDGLGPNGGPLPVNRAVIKKGEQAQVVYYWFHQRGRMLTNEFAIKWFIFYDGMTRKRTDGGLVRFVAPLQPGEAIEDVDLRLVQFIRAMNPRLQGYLPN